MAAQADRPLSGVGGAGNKRLCDRSRNPTPSTIRSWALWRPTDYHLTFDFRRWLRLMPVITVVTSPQAFAEELFFRGYVLHALGLVPPVGGR